jgi:hypothetical protein
LQKGVKNIVIMLEIQSWKFLPKKLPLFIVKIPSKKNSTSKEDCKKQNNYSAPKHPT